MSHARRVEKGARCGARGASATYSRRIAALGSTLEALLAGIHAAAIEVTSTTPHQNRPT